jgi:CRISPR-associated protein Cas5d
MQKEIVLEVWGDFACFSRPESKVERLSYPVMTPSAARGILSAVYSKPVEFYWQVKKIEVLRPIRYISFKRNEVINSKIGTKPKPILVEDTRETGAEHRTQRQSVVLKDVRYRITAEIIKRDSFRGSLEQLYEQAQRRINSGKCFYQPSLGLREFVCYFDNPGDLKPIEESLDLGIMLYDVFDLHKFEVTKKAEPYISLFHAKMENGVIEIPEFDSELVLKP